jgi:hypothetical protein
MSDPTRLVSITSRALRVPLLVVAAIAALPLAPPLRAQSAGTLEIRRYTIDAGGGGAAAGAPQVVTTIGQPDAIVVNAGNLQLRGGFWGARVQPAPDDVVFQNGFE